MLDTRGGSLCAAARGKDGGGGRGYFLSLTRLAQLHRLVLELCKQLVDPGVARPDVVRVAVPRLALST